MSMITMMYVSIVSDINNDDVIHLQDVHENHIQNIFEEHNGGVHEMNDDVHDIHNDVHDGDHYVCNDGDVDYDDS